MLHAQPKRCVPCRRERRQRKSLNLELSEQWANFSGGISELVALADTYEAMRNTAKALACLRQAKNKTRSDATRQTLQRRIEHLEHPSSA